MADLVDKIGASCQESLGKPANKVAAVELPKRLACEAFAGGIGDVKAIRADVNSFVKDFNIDKKKAFYALSVAGLGVAATVVTKQPTRPDLPQGVIKLVQHVMTARTLHPGEVVKATNLLRQSTQLEGAKLQEEFRAAVNVLKDFQPTGGSSVWNPFIEQFSSLAERSNQLLSQRRNLYAVAKSLDQNLTTAGSVGGPWDAVHGRLIQPLANTAKSAARISDTLKWELSAADKIRQVRETLGETGARSKVELEWVKDLTSVNLTK